MEKTTNIDINTKKKELENEFNKNKQEAASLEEQMKGLRVKQQENINSLIRLQGAFQFLTELEKGGEKSEG
jgi:hypothetical protein